MSRTLRRKLEDAFVAHLQANAATLGIDSSKIFSARGQTEPAIPFLIVEASNATANDDLSQVAEVEIVIHYRSEGTVGGSERASVDELLDKVHTLIMKPTNDEATWSDSNPEGGALLTALNKPASGPDSRTIKPLHIYDIWPSEDNGDVVTEGWVDQLVYAVVAQPMDSH